MSNRFSFRRLVLSSPARIYDVSFASGVNVIAGPISTGKSSILALLDYVLGASKAPVYPEISKCSDCLVECLVGTEVITLRRSLKSSTADVDMYTGSIDDVLKGNRPVKSVSPRQNLTASSVSSELMAMLGFGELKVKNAPTQATSDLSVLSV